MSKPSTSASQSSVTTLPRPPKNLGSPGEPDAEANAGPGVDDLDRATERALEILPRAKCPYLAGRPPHGSHHLWPSGLNVCYARPREDKPYGGVSKETQAARCFC